MPISTTPKPKTMKFFDLHCHPGLKTLFLEQDEQRISAWANLTPNDGLFGNILESQSSFKMLTEKGNINLVCLTLHPPEMGMLDQILLKIGARLFFENFMNAERLRKMFSGDHNYQQVFQDEFENIIRPPLPADNIPSIKKVHLLKSWDEYKPNDNDTLFVLFNIEGGHTFYGEGNKFESIETAISNFYAFLDKGFLTFYLTPTHLTPSVFSTHAYGNKILTKGPLLPRNLGITEYGGQLIKAAYDRNVLIDIKHMSLVSRRIFYEIRKNHFPDKPIIASHMGINGMSWNDFREKNGAQHQSGAIKLKLNKIRGPLEGLYFYPLSINLFAQDVYEILSSKGLIGISLDVRILGGKDNQFTNQNDFLSKEEYDFLKGCTSDDDFDAKIKLLAQDVYSGNAGLQPLEDIPEELDNDDIQEINEEAEELFQLDSQPVAAQEREYFSNHIRLLVNHLIRIYQISNWYGLPEPWEHICIGSDFDGLVKAVDCCRNSTEFDYIYGPLIQGLEDARNELQLSFSLTDEEIIDNFCFKNAERILARHFNTNH